MLRFTCIYVTIGDPKKDIGGSLMDDKKYFERFVSTLKQRFSKIVDFRQQSKVVHEQITILFIVPFLV